MKQYGDDIKDVIDEASQQYTTSVRFESVWKAAQKSRLRKFGLRTLVATPLIVVICFLSLTVVTFAGYKAFRNIDRTDYPFVDDSMIKGKWESVDFVDRVEDFNPENKYWGSDLYLSSLVFINGGKMLTSIENGNLAYTNTTWTKGIIISEQEKTAASYVIKDINGAEYMFFQWKSGDYVFRNMEPKFYVLKKVDSNDYSSYQVKVVNEDETDYSFTDDAEMKGKWRSVDFVKTIDSFKTEEKGWIDDLYLTGLDIEENGKLTFKTISGDYSTHLITWTKGLILDSRDKTASKCVVKDIDGITYMFYEWKSGDYIYRGRAPWYYVLEKVQ